MNQSICDHAVIYARYSSDKQNEQSIEGQLRICEDYCRLNNYEITARYIDRATSGKTDNRIEFQQMIKDSQKKKFKHIVVYKLDRFSRDRYDSAIYKRLLKLNGISVLSATEQIGNSPEGIILESLLEGIAEYYSAELSQKVKRGNFENIQKGYSIGGPRLYGYKVIDKRYHVDDQEAKIVYMVFSMYANGSTVVDILDTLISHLNAQEKPFSSNGILKMLRNIKYTGRFYYRGELYANYYPRIIDDATFETVKGRLAQNKAHPTHKEMTSSYLLSRKLFYRDFGNLLIGCSGTSKQGKSYYYYRLSDICKTTDAVKPIAKDYIESMVFDATVKYVLNEEILSPLIDIVYVIIEKEFKKDKVYDVLAKRLSKTNKEIENIIKAIKSGVSSSALNEELISLEKQKKELEFQLESEKANQALPVTKQGLTDFLYQLKESSAFSRTAIIDMFVKYVIIEEESMMIVYNVIPGYHSSTIDLTELKSSSENLMVRHQGLEPGTQ